MESDCLNNDRTALTNSAFASLGQEGVPLTPERKEIAICQTPIGGEKGPSNPQVEWHDCSDWKLLALPPQPEYWKNIKQSDWEFLY